MLFGGGKDFETLNGKVNRDSETLTLYPLDFWAQFLNFKYSKCMGKIKPDTGS